MKNNNKTRLSVKAISAAFIILQLLGGTASADYRGYWMDAVEIHQNAQAQYTQSQTTHLHDASQEPAPTYTAPVYQEPVYQPQYEPAPYGYVPTAGYNAG